MDKKSNNNNNNSSKNERVDFAEEINMDIDKKNNNK